MSINITFQNINHPKYILNQLKTSNELPFKEILSASCVTQNFNNNITTRDRIFTPDLTMWGFLSQVLNDDKSCQAAVARVISLFIKQNKTPPSANTAAYSKARSRLPECIFSDMARKSARQIEEQVLDNWLWRGRNIKLIDGSTLFMPDTKENQAIFPQSKCQKEGLGFPIARIFAIISYATGAILDLAVAACSGKGSGEPSLLRQLIHGFKFGDIVVGDACYASFFSIAMLIKCGVEIVFPFHGARGRDFRRGKRLGKKDHIVQWKKPQRPKEMDQKTYAELPHQITIREVMIQKKRSGFRTQNCVIITTFLDCEKVCKKDLEELYDNRWHVELDLRAIKDTMNMGILRGKTPSMVRKEIWAHVLAYNMIRKIMAQAAVVHNKNPRNLSFKLALQAIESFRQAGLLSEIKVQTYMQLLKVIAYKKIGNRCGRLEPRRLKRRPKNYPLLMKPRNHYHGVAA